MDAKSKVNFIHSVADGQKIPCPKCGALNRTGARFCITCGAALGQAEEPAPVVEELICPKCGTVNESGYKFCVSCGTPLEQGDAPKEEPDAPFAPIKEVAPKKEEEPSEPKQAAPVAAVFFQVEEEEEEVSIFAEGLPAWDIEPPQMLVRRKRK